MSQATLGRDSPPIDDPDTAPLTYQTCRVGSMTFQNTKIREFVESNLQGRVLNACAGETQLTHDGEVVRNDISKSNPALDSTVDVRSLRDKYPADRFDTIIYDPPWSEHLAREKYDTEFPGYGEDVMAQFDELLRDDGRLITIGQQTNAMPLKWGYRRSKISVINTFGRRFDAYVTIDDAVTTVPDLPYTLESTVPMNRLKDDLSGRGTQDDPFPITYHYAPTEAALTDAVESFIDRYTAGRTLDLFSRRPTTTTTESIFRNDPPDTEAASGLNPHFAFDPFDIDERLPHGYHTLIFNPPKRYFREMVDGGEMGKDKSIKQSVNNLLAEGQCVIQVGPTSTFMSSTDNDPTMAYKRDAVAIFSCPSKANDIIVTVDGDQYHPVAGEESPRWNRFETPPSGPTQYKCIHCDETWYAIEYPALGSWSCTECGAAPGTHCIETLDGKEIPANPMTPREGLHMARENWARDSMDEMDCPAHDGGHVVLEMAQYQPFMS